MKSLELLTPRWPAHTNVRAAFTLRQGGVSAGPYESLNLGLHVGDDTAAVLENRRRVRAALSLPDEPVWLQQVHGVEVLNLDVAPAVPCRADAVVTRTPGRVCAIQVADCMPVLFAAQSGEAIGAAHAGWRGLVGGVLEATVDAMRIEPARLIAWLGPAIGPAHFEVGDEVRTAFLSQSGQEADAAFSRNARGRWQCDLYSLARLRLTALGLNAIAGGEWCTYADEQRFFSFRRESRTGRMAALIWLEP